MELEELLDEWTEGKSGMRPRRVQRLRDDIMKHTGLTVPRRLPEIQSWTNRMKGQVTRKLRDAVDSRDEPPPDQE